MNEKPIIIEGKDLESWLLQSLSNLSMDFARKIVADYIRKNNMKIPSRKEITLE